MATKEKTKAVSYRRICDYTASISWTYEMNREVLRCYKRAKDDPKIGYMKQMKTYWDKLYPDYNNFTEKQLRQQATFVESKELVLEAN